MGQLDDMKKEIDELKQTQGLGKKEWKLPFMTKIKTLSMGRQNKILVFFIKTNGFMTVNVYPIENETVKIDDKIYAASADYILRYKRLPCLIIKEWDMEPFSSATEYVEAAEKGRLTFAQQTIWSRMQKDLIKPKVTFNLGMIAIIGIVLVGGYFILKAFGLF